MVLTISVTSDCNLNCRICGGWDFTKHKVRQGNSLPLEIIKKMLDEGRTRGNWYLEITGGEPFLHPQIMDIISYAEKSGYWTYILTNGLLLNEDIIESISSLRVMLRISIYSANKDTHEYLCQDDTFDHLVDVIRMLRRRGISFGLCMPVFRANVNEIQDTIKFAFEEGCTFIRVFPGGKYYKAKNEDIDSSLFEQILSSIVEIIANHRDWVDLESDTLMNVSNPIELLTTRRCTAGCNYYHIDSNMIIHSCPFISSQNSIKEIKFNDHLDFHDMDMFMDDYFKGLIGNLKGACRECEYNTTCLGGCLSEKTMRSLESNEEQPVCMKRILQSVVDRYDAEAMDVILQSWVSTIYKDSFEDLGNRSCIRHLPFWTINFKK